MSLLPILELPHPRLRNVAGALDTDRIATAQFQRLLDDMLETMYTAPDIGLAATQVDVHERFMVIDVTEARDQPLVFINPVIRHRTEQLREHQEGCLSIPGIFADVTRADGIRSEEHTSELQSLMRISYAVFCLKKKTKTTQPTRK